MRTVMRYFDFLLVLLLVLLLEVACSRIARGAAAAADNSTMAAESSSLLSLLEEVQVVALETLGPSSPSPDPDFDPKTYVDIPLLYPFPQTLQAFRNFSNGTITPGSFEDFLNRYFDAAGSDLVNHSSSDFVVEPKGFLSNVNNSEVWDWALQVHSIWLQLSKGVSKSVQTEPDQHTLLYLPNAVIIPGSRFREVYYWDTYWVIRGLIVSQMFETAKGIIENLMLLANTFGFVPNGARTYYENRSQPPLLSAMVRTLYEATSDLNLLKEALPILVREHKFWNSGAHQVHIIDRHGNSHYLSRYSANWDSPRPESYTIDTELAEGLSEEEQKLLYHNIASTAESGWDFSTRWMRDGKELRTLQTANIVPTDLNAYLLKMEENIAFFAKLLGNETIMDHFMSAARARKHAIKAILWSDEMNQWLDYAMSSQQSGNQSAQDVEQWHEENWNKNTFLSNFIPLWCGALSPGDERIGLLIDALENSGLLQPSGLATSLQESGQQWDFPNGWAPLQHIIIEGLLTYGEKKGKALAETIAQRWLRTNYVTYKETGHMQEKYDVRACGVVGGGGEYTNQVGFGWSNGVLLALLEGLGWPKDLSINCD